MSTPQTSPPHERFAALYEAGYADVLRFLQRRVDDDRAEDAAHEVFLVVWRRIDRLPADLDEARAYLFGVARHVLLSERRGLRRREALAVRIAETASGSVPEPDEQVDARRDLARAWRRLRPAEQESLALTLFDELSSAAAAQVLGIGESAYRVRLHRARQALRRELDASPPDRRAASPDAAAAPTTTRIPTPVNGRI